MSRPLPRNLLPFHKIVSVILLLPHLFRGGSVLSLPAAQHYSSGQVVPSAAVWWFEQPAKFHIRLRGTLTWCVVNTWSLSLAAHHRATCRVSLDQQTTFQQNRTDTAAHQECKDARNVFCSCSQRDAGAQFRLVTLFSPSRRREALGSLAGPVC